MSVWRYLQWRNGPLIVVKLDWTPFPFPSPPERAFISVSPEPNEASLWASVYVCVCAYVSVCLCFIRDCEMLSHPHLKRACWGAMETIPRVIFILNTTYSLPDSHLFVSFYSPFSPYLSLLPFFFFLLSHPHTGSQAERFPCLFFNGKKWNSGGRQSTVELDSILFRGFFSAQGLCFPNTLSQLLCWNMDKTKLWNIEPVDNFSKHMLCACVWKCDCVGVLACVCLCVKKTPLGAVDEHCYWCSNTVIINLC